MRPLVLTQRCAIFLVFINIGPRYLFRQAVCMFSCKSLHAVECKVTYERHLKCTNKVGLSLIVSHHKALTRNQVIDADPSNTDAKMKLAELYEIMDEPRKALELVYQGTYFHSLHFSTSKIATQSLMLGSAARDKQKARHPLMHPRVPRPVPPCSMRNLTPDQKEEPPLKAADLLWLT